MNVQGLKGSESVEEFEVKTATQEMKCCWCSTPIKNGDSYTEGRFIDPNEKSYGYTACQECCSVNGKKS